MKKIMGLVVPALVLFLSLYNPADGTAQNDTTTLSFSPESSITVDGTSNRDDWTVTAREFEGEVSLNETEGEPVPEIVKARLVVPVQQMTGGKSSIMDRLMRDALKAGEHPEIEFVLTATETEPGDDSDAFVVRTTGDLTLAGVTRAIELEMEGTRLENGTYRFTGSYPLNMTDYDMEPPSAMFGALRTGEEVVVNFEVLTVE